MLRRTKSQAHIRREMNLPPLVWDVRELTLSADERKTYDKAASALTRSYKAFKPLADRRTRKRPPIAGGGGAMSGASAASKRW